MPMGTTNVRATCVLVCPSLLPGYISCWSGANTKSTPCFCIMSTSRSRVRGYLL